jgi:hypothetical protein
MLTALVHPYRPQRLCKPGVSAVRETSVHLVVVGLDTMPVRAVISELPRAGGGVVAQISRVGGAVALLLVAACGGSGEASPTTLPPTTASPSTTVTTTTTLPPTTTTIARAISQSFLNQTIDGGIAFERQQGDQLADSLLTISAQIGSLDDRIESLGEPPAGFDEAVELMLQAIAQAEGGYAAAAEAARAADQAALDDAVAIVDEAFWRLVDANVALATAQECAPGG